MKRADLEHILRASKGVTGETEFIVIGSQAILGAHPDAPRELRESMEADLYARDRPDLSLLLEGTLGELSMFHTTFGYFADGVSPETATLPRGWE
ncbi:MAG: KfrB domain-containing protein, partial [Limisphaerales bacterium]